MLATLRHPRVVQCIGATDNAATPWLVLEYLERTLYEAVADATESAIVSMLCDVLSACAYLHSRPCPIARQPASPRVAPGPQRRQHPVGPAQFLWRRFGAWSLEASTPRSAARPGPGAPCAWGSWTPPPSFGTQPASRRSPADDPPLRPHRCIVT